MPIPPSEIIQYMDRFGVPDGDEEAFMFLIGEMDTEYLIALRERNEKGSKEHPRGNTPTPSH